MLLYYRSPDVRGMGAREAGGGRFPSFIENQDKNKVMCSLTTNFAGHQRMRRRCRRIGALGRPVPPDAQSSQKDEALSFWVTGRKYEQSDMRTRRTM